MYSDHNEGNFDVDFEAFFKKLYPRLCVYCNFKFGFDAPAAEDIVSSGFAKLWEVRQRLTGEEGAKAYLYKIIDSLCLNNLKHQEVENRYFIHSPAKGGEPMELHFDSIDLKELRTAIDASIAELPEQMRNVFEMSRYEGMKYKEIAKHLNISAKTVETQMSRALVKLREKLSVWLTMLAVFISPII